MAERVGFEPTVEFPLHTLSKRAPSTTRTSLRVCRINRLRASGSARKLNCDRNCDTPSNLLRSLTGVRAVEHARSGGASSDVDSDASAHPGLLGMRPSARDRERSSAGPAPQRRAPSACRPLVCWCAPQPQGYFTTGL